MRPSTFFVTLDFLPSTLDFWLSTLDTRQLPRLSSTTREIWCEPECSERFKIMETLVGNLWEFRELIVPNDLHATRLYGQHVNAMWADWSKNDLHATRLYGQHMDAKRAWLVNMTLHATRLYVQHVNTTWADCSKRITRDQTVWSTRECNMSWLYQKTTYTWPDCMSC